MKVAPILDMVVATKRKQTEEMEKNDENVCVRGRRCDVSEYVCNMSHLPTLPMYHIYMIILLHLFQNDSQQELTTFCIP